MAATDPRNLRIGELSKRAGVSAELLRAWERRYELFSPARTESGYRLYSELDVDRAQRMRFHIDAGLSAAQAAAETGADFRATRAAAPEPSDPQSLGAGLWQALDELDDERTHAALDRLLASFGVETVLREVVLPHMRRLGERWERGEAMIAREHFASSLLRGRLLGLARGWGAGAGPHALLACVPGDQHDIGLICFGLALRGQGWRITFLGADTPLDTVLEAVEQLTPELVAVAASLHECADDARPGLERIAGLAPLALAGRGVDAKLAAAVGARHMSEDPLTAATIVARDQAG